MVPSLDDMLARWREDPRPSVTIQLCQAIADACAAGAPSEEHRGAATEVGREATSRYPEDVSVLLAVGRMHLALGELSEAHVVILQAAKLPPNDPRTFKLLGELMLRRGDARRAVRAFERALTGGIIDAHTRLWFDQAKRLVDLQDSGGPNAVVAEMEQLLTTLMQPPLPFERVELAPSEPPPPSEPWYKETLLGTGQSGGKRIRQQTLLGLAAITPGRETLPSEDVEDDEAGPTQLMRKRPDPVVMSGRTGASPLAQRAVPPPDAPILAGAGPDDDPVPSAISEEDSYAETLVRPDVALAEVRKRFGERVADAAAGVALAPELPSGADAAPAPARDDASFVSVTDEAELMNESSVDEGDLTYRMPAPVVAEPGPQTAVTRVENPVVLRALLEADQAAGRVLQSPPISAPQRSAPFAPPMPRVPPPPPPPRSPAYSRPPLHVLAPTLPLESLDAASSLLDEDSSGEHVVPRAPEPPSGGGGPRMSPGELVDEFSYRPASVPPKASPVAKGFISQPPPGPGSTISRSAPAWTPKKRRSRALLWVGIAIVAFAVGGGAGFVVLQQRHGQQSQVAGAIAARAEEAVRKGGSRGLTEAAQLLKEAESQSPGTHSVLMARLHEQAVRIVDEGAGAAPLHDAMTFALARGASEGELAFAAVLAAEDKKDARAVDDLVRRNDGDPARAQDAFYQLAVGHVLEARGDPHAVDRYDAAVRAEGALTTAKMHAARAALLLGDPKQADGRARAFADAVGDTPEARVITALAHAVAHTSAPGAPGRRPPVDVANVADLPRTLRAIAWTLAFDPNRAAQGMSAAIDDADTPAVALFCASYALKYGDMAVAQEAAERAAALAPAYGPARAMTARVRLLAGDVDKALELANGIEGPEGAEVRAFAAYENGDVTRVGSSIAALGGESARAAAVVVAARDRLKGAKPLGKDRIGALAADALWSDVVAADAALDVGDLKRAKAVIDGWPDAAKQPIRALRLARLLRYQGKVEEARKAIAAAAPTHGALVERALLDAEGKDERTRAVASLDAKLEPERAWLEVYLRARQGIIGLTGARKALAKARNPPPDAPLSLRVVAALAVGEMQDGARADEVVRPLVKSWANNPDVVRAGVGVGLLPPEALKKLGK